MTNTTTAFLLANVIFWLGYFIGVYREKKRFYQEASKAVKDMQAFIRSVKEVEEELRKEKEEKPEKDIFKDY